MAHLLLGNLDKNMRHLLAPLVPAMVPFLGLALGLTINLNAVVEAGLLGIALGLFVVFVGGAVLFLADKLTGGDGVAGLAAATTAGNAALVPAIIATANPVYAPAADHATVLVAASVVVSAVLCPIVTSAWAKRLQKKARLQDSEDNAAEQKSPAPKHVGSTPELT